MGRLTMNQKQFYKENGYIVLKDLVPPEELETMSEEYDKLFARKNQEKMESSWVGSDENDRQSNSEFTVSRFCLDSELLCSVCFSSVQCFWNKGICGYYLRMKLRLP